MLKYALPTLILSCISAFANEYADPCCDPCIKCAQLGPNGGPDYMVTPNAGPCVANGADIFVTGDFIYWEARQDHMTFASFASAANFGNNNGSSNNISMLTGIDNRQPAWRYEPGFKVGLGILFDHDGWDLYGNYTWLRTTTQHRSLSSAGSSTLVVVDYGWANLAPSYLIGNSTEVFTSDSFQWKHHFNVVDLELGRNFYISCALQLRPHFGLKGTWQTQRVFAFGAGTTNGFPFNSNGFHKNDFWGVGIRAGLDTSWHFYRCFSFIGNIAVSELYGKFDTNSQVNLTNVNTSAVITTLSAKDNFYSTKPVLEAFIGLRWEDWYCCNEYHISLDAGWEQQWWDGQNQFISLITETRLGDLELSGLTIQLRFDF